MQTGTVLSAYFVLQPLQPAGAGTFRQCKSGWQPALRRPHNGTFDRALPENIQPDSCKPTVLYAPTFGALSSLPHWAEKLSRLSGDVNLICKLHHGTSSRPQEAASLAPARRHLKQLTDSARHTLALLAKADYVLTDNSGFIFDAIHVDKRVILLDFPGMTELLDGEKKLFHARQRRPANPRNIAGCS